MVSLTYYAPDSGSYTSDSEILTETAPFYHRHTFNGLGWRRYLNSTKKRDSTQEIWLIGQIYVNLK